MFSFVFVCKNLKKLRHKQEKVYYSTIKIFAVFCRKNENGENFADKGRRKKDGGIRYTNKLQSYKHKLVHSPTTIQMFEIHGQAIQRKQKMIANYNLQMICYFTGIIVHGVNRMHIHYVLYYIVICIHTQQVPDQFSQALSKALFLS